MSSVSVIIPTYRSVFVREAIDSVLRQTQQPLEIILVDGSPDLTRVQIEDCIDHIRYISQPPQGVSHARNVGIAAARGDYVALLDADDLWLPDKLQTQLSLLERYPAAGFCFSTTWNLVDVNDAAIPQEPYSPSELRSWIQSSGQVKGSVYGDVHELLLSVNCVATSSVIAKKEILLRVGLFDESLKNGEDYDLWLRLASVSSGIYVCAPTSRYRVHCDGLSGSWDSRAELFYRANIRVLEKHLKNSPSATTRKALSRQVADFAGFQLKQRQLSEAKDTALRSLRLRPNRIAVQFYVEAACPRLYSLVARIARTNCLK
jgi:glycosyltransferase involved in cell wall biosynthesis